jgi:hypothetical protein
MRVIDVFAYTVAKRDEFHSARAELPPPLISANAGGMSARAEYGHVGTQAGDGECVLVWAYADACGVSQHTIQLSWRCHVRHSFSLRVLNNISLFVCRFPGAATDDGCSM